MMGEPQDLDDADDGSELKHAPFVNPDPSESPITFLGYYKGKIVFAMPEGEIREIATGEVAKLIQLDLYNCVEGQSFLTYWRDRENKFQRNAASIWFIRQCRDAGYWEASRAQRSLGVWPGDDGQVVLHRGKELWIYEGDQDPEIVSVSDMLRSSAGQADAPIYRLRGEAPKPGQPSLAEDGAWIRRQLDLWRFDAIGDVEEGLTGADLVAGWIMAGLMGAVAPFRPHMLIYAQGGSGKTTLIRFVHALISALAGGVIDSFSPAGLRSDLAGMARPVMIDEAEAAPQSNGQGPVEQALEVIRRMATGEGAVRKMGDMSGGAVTQTAIGAVLMAAVNPVKLQSADASRIADLRLLSLTGPKRPGEPDRRLATAAELRKIIETAKRLSPGLLARALTNADRYASDVAQLQAAFLRKGHDPRAADLVSALAAGRRLLTADQALDEADADDEARFWGGLLDMRALTEIRTNTGQDCLAHLFAWSSGQHVHDRIITIGELIKKVAINDTDGGWADALKELGLIVKAVPDETGVAKLWLFVANNHPALEKVYRNTRWPDYRKTLTFLDELGEDFVTQSTKHGLRFGLVLSRALGVPLGPWLNLPPPVTRVTQGVG